jgi:2-amino-4-hydroxy-6-hydroxymethyldihydropteridine diphosphokinase
VSQTSLDPMGIPRRCVISLGSNLGDRLEHLQQAVDAVLEAPGITGVRISPVYETAPVGGPDQDDYLNAVLLVDTVLSYRVLLERAHAVEGALGRVRGERWGARVIDVDLIDYDGEKSDEQDLLLPHPRAHERAFVLTPWLDVDGDAEVVGRGRVSDLLSGLAGQSVKRRDDLVLRLPE